MVAWFSMAALIAMVAIAELLQGEAAAGRSSNADAATQLNAARRALR